jgi:hypothetical protein
MTANMHLTFFRKQQRKIASSISLVLLCCILINCLSTPNNASKAIQALHHTATNSINISDSYYQQPIYVLQSQQIGSLDTLAALTNKLSLFSINDLTQHCANLSQCDMQNSLSTLLTIIVIGIFSILFYIYHHLSAHRKLLPLHLNVLTQRFDALLNFPRQHLIFCVQLN